MKISGMKKCYGSLHTFQQNKLLDQPPKQVTPASTQSSKPESRTSGLCYCTQLKWHPAVHGDGNRISRSREKTNITCCALSQDFPFSHHLHQVPLSLIFLPQRLSSSSALRPQHSQPNQFTHIQQSNHFHNVSESVSEKEGKLLSNDLWKAIAC